MSRAGWVCAIGMMLSGCSTVGLGPRPLESVVGGDPEATYSAPQSLAANLASHGYVPLDPLPVSLITCDVGEDPELILDALPDLTVRFAVAEIRGSGGAAFGSSKITVEGRSYRAVLDYTNADAIAVTFMVSSRIQDGAEVRYHSPSEPLPEGASVSAYSAEIREPNRVYLESEGWEEITVPVYVGVGLRLTADVYALRGGATLSGLSVIGLEAEGGRLAGTLTVQTLGITGKAIAVGLPLPNKLDQTTIENAILAIGASRALMYGGTDEDPITITPRLTGLYSPIGSDPRLINALYSELAQNPQEWSPCGA